jgi:hypothetical protein
MKNRILLFITLLFILTTLLMSGAVVSDFRAESGMNQVELKWVVTAEQNLKGYRIMRSMDGNTFQKIGFVAALGVTSNEQSYKFVDKSVFKSSSRTYHYKLQFVNMDGTENSYEKAVKVSPQISSARQTWGSLKAMFR